MHPLLRWPVRMVAMSAGYAVGGPVGGLLGLGVAFWVSRERQQPVLPRTDTLPPDVRDAYRSLGVKPAVDNDTLRTAYRRLMNRHHPDKLDPGAITSEVEAARQATLRIRAAYDLLRKRRGF
jgi:DnaJ-domain-containing protein 1